MTLVTEQFGFSIRRKRISPKKKRERRTQLSVLIVLPSGEVTDRVKCLPVNKDKTIADCFINSPEAGCVNVILLNGHTEVVTRKEWLSR